MKSKVFVIPASGLNSNIEEIDVSLFVDEYLIDGTSVVENARYYPSQIVIDNYSETTIGFVLLSDSREQELSIQKPEYFDFIPIRAKTTFNNPKLTKASKLIIKKLSLSSMSENIIVSCIGYHK